MPTQATAVVVVPLNDEAIESRPSFRRTISTRIPSVKSTRKGGNPILTPKSRFAFHWNKYESKKLEVLRDLHQDLELVHSAPNSRRSSRFLSSIAQASNRLSVVSMASCNSAVSGVSSMANSIYSVLSEDWNRPFSFARSKSHRYPTSLQSNVRALPPYDQLTASIVTTSIQRVKTGTQMIAATRGVRSRGLQNPDGSVFQLAPEHGLYSADIRITWRQVTENFVEDDDDPALAISRPCLSALPKTRDRFGFVEYNEEGDEDEEEEEIQEQRCHTGGPDAANILKSQCGIHSGPAGTDDCMLADSGRPILDVNDTSAMIAAGINPSEPHPNPEAFYRLHYPTEHQASIHEDPQETSEATDTFHCSDSHNLRHSPASNGPVDDSTFLQDFHSVLARPNQPNAVCLRRTCKSRVVQKWICKPLKKALSQKQRSTQCTVTQIRRAGPGMDRSYSDTVTSTSAEEWLQQLPGGHMAAGKFDRDWLDAQPSSSFAQSRRV
ncbi:hypothetical protein BGZ47_001511 [Haplosporangium gracile]|nr:hypothetical protein BGZ47_001511 [Haplosporangium gracile]